MRYAEVFAENESPTNVVGSGQVHGLGVGDKGEPGFKKSEVSLIRRRSERKTDDRKRRDY